MPAIGVGGANLRPLLSDPFFPFSSLEVGDEDDPGFGYGYSVELSSILSSSILFTKLSVAARIDSGFGRGIAFPLLRLLFFEMFSSFLPADRLAAAALSHFFDINTCYSV